MMSNIHTIILMCLGLCIILLCSVVGMKTILNLLVRGAVGLSLIIAINIFMPEALRIGINLLTMGCTTVLGIPGIVMLYLIGFIIR